MSQNKLKIPAVLLAFFIASLLSFGSISSTKAASFLYPDLKTVPPADLRLDYQLINGATHYLLRFSNTSWNAGEGRLELRGETILNNKTKVNQRIYDSLGNFTDVYVGDFVFHPSHNHFHFENYADYELWTQAEYNNWIASGRNNGQAQKRGSKTTFCIMDNVKIQNLPGSPASPQYSQCGQTLQGMSIGWGDVYVYTLPDQWIDLGTSSLPAGSYVLRSVVDPKNLIVESANNDPAREGAAANEAVTYFTYKAGKLRITR